MANKPEKYTDIKFVGLNHEQKMKSAEQIGFNCACNLWHTYHKQFIKDNIPSEGDVVNILEDSHYGSTHSNIAREFIELTKERLGVK